MQRLTFTFSSQWNFSSPASDHHFTLRVVPHDDPAQTISQLKTLFDPVDEIMEQTDGYGNTLMVGGCASPHTHFQCTVSGIAQVDSAQGRGTELDEAFRFPSPLTSPGAHIQELRSRLSKPADDGSNQTIDPVAIFAHAQQLCALVYNTMDYVSGTTDVCTSAEEALEQRRGVCQDYAHILEALLRLDNIPARYVSGLMIGEGATHAWVEFFDGHTWWGIDPTNNCEAGDFYIAVARGRDFSDCPMEQGVLKGGGGQQLTTSVSVEPIPAP